MALDLDGCTFDNRHRQLRIARAWGDRSGDPRLDGLRVEHFQDWSFTNTLVAAGVAPDEAAELTEAFRPFWLEHFFANEFVVHDLPLPGAARFARALADAGVWVTYLTGRSDIQRPATLGNLRRYGFPIDEAGAGLLTKPDEGTTDGEWKRRGFAELTRTHRLVGFIDNEPGHIHYANDTFGDAMVVWMQTDHSPNARIPGSEVPRIRGFLRSNAE